MNKPPDETLKQGRNRSWLLIKYAAITAPASTATIVLVRFSINSILSRISRSKWVFCFVNVTTRYPVVQDQLGSNLMSSLYEQSVVDIHPSYPLDNRTQ